MQLSFREQTFVGFKFSFTILSEGEPNDFWPFSGRFQPENIMRLQKFLSRRQKSISAAILMLAASAGLATSNAQAGDAVIVTIDRAKVLRISRPADTIIIGNPAIADATIQDQRTLVLTGRSFGVTNIVILDSDGEPIVDETIVVQGNETNTVPIYRRSVRETLACSPVCEPTLTIGDDTKAFEAASGQIKQRNSLSDSVARKN
jgi:hypothetical protein